MLIEFNIYGLALCTLICIIMLPLFFTGMMGAGDIKIISCIIGYLGLIDGIKVCVFAFVLAGIYSFIKLILTKSLINRVKYFLTFIQSIYLGIYISYEKEKNSQIRLGIFFSFAVVIWRINCG